ncbi:hypothetical protein Glove_174g125 [Diversispora epigaea]|uniref:Uncharacterized protein n=1 Tax=Diversispora epigaea TaxID=1348612 RepID=A0A397IXN2_9GLOM|nr:hypothetical protein Glove_174g125 [Diversispora epigaea]
MSTLLYFPDQLADEDKLPYLIGLKKTIKEYNNFLERQESSGYKYQRKNNGDVYIIDMNNEEHDSVVGLLLRYFNAPNNNVILNPPIEVSGNRFHFSPSLTSELIAPDVLSKVHARIICEVGNCQSTPDWTAKCQLLMNQGAEYQEWEFGTHWRRSNVPTTCNVPNLPSFRIDIPIAQVFWDLPIPVGEDEYVPHVPSAITAKSEEAPKDSPTPKNNANTEVFQLEALSLNYLRSQNISAIPDDDSIPKLQPCNKPILNF